MYILQDSLFAHASRQAPALKKLFPYLSAAQYKISQVSVVAFDLQSISAVPQSLQISSRIVDAVEPIASYMYTYIARTGSSLGHHLNDCQPNRAEKISQVEENGLNE